MITRIDISDYRSCLKCSFDLQPHLSVLIGPNASGKTNILNAILLLKKLKEKQETIFYKEPSDELSITKSKLKVFFDIDGKKAILNTVIITDTDENNNDVVMDYSTQWYMKDFTGSAKRLKMPQRFQYKDSLFLKHRRYWHGGRIIIEKGESVSRSAEKAFFEISRFISEMRYYSASQFTNPGNCPISFEVEKEGSKSRGIRLLGHTKFLFDLYSEYKEKSRSYQQFFDIIGPNGIGLVDDIHFKEIVTSSVDYSVKSGGRIKERKREKVLIIPQFTIGKHGLSPNQLSEGTFKTITLMFYLITETSSLLLIEEPEVCVHHGLLNSIVEIIKTYSVNKQIVLSTHSDFVLDKVSPDNVYKVSNVPEKGTKITHIPKSMSKRELIALKKYLETEGNLGEYWKHGALEA